MDENGILFSSILSIFSDTSMIIPIGINMNNITKKLLR
jgi:hypothetical protein